MQMPHGAKLKEVWHVQHPEWEAGLSWCWSGLPWSQEEQKAWLSTVLDLVSRTRNEQETRTKHAVVPCTLQLEANVSSLQHLEF